MTRSANKIYPHPDILVDNQLLGHWIRCPTSVAPRAGVVFRPASLRLVSRPNPYRLLLQKTRRPAQAARCWLSRCDARSTWRELTLGCSEGLVFPLLYRITLFCASKTPCNPFDFEKVRWVLDCAASGEWLPATVTHVLSHPAWWRL